MVREVDAAAKVFSAHIAGACERLQNYGSECRAGVYQDLFWFQRAVASATSLPVFVSRIQNRLSQTTPAPAGASPVQPYSGIPTDAVQASQIFL